MNSVAIITLNYNSKSHTLELLESLKKLKGTFDVFVLENGSNREVLEESDIPDLDYTIHYFKSEKNLGFAGGNNYLLKKAQEVGFDSYWLLNNDTFVKNNTLEELLKTFDNYENAGILGSLLTYEDNKTVWWCGSEIDLKKGKIQKLYFGQNKKQVPKKTFTTDEVTGASMLISNKVLKRVGYLDESFFHTAEDTDYSLRTIKKGYKLYVNPKSKVIHKVGKSSGSEYSPLHMYYVERGRVLLMKKHKKLSADSFIYLVPLWIKRTIAPILKTGSLKASIYTVLGIFDGLRGVEGKKLLGL